MMTGHRYCNNRVQKLSDRVREWAVFLKVFLAAQAL